jgi:hypothetical protein
MLAPADEPVHGQRVAPCDQRSGKGRMGQPLALRAIPALVEICPPKAESYRCQSFHRTLERIDANWRERPEVQALLAELERSQAGKETSPEAP